MLDFRPSNRVFPQHKPDSGVLMILILQRHSALAGSDKVHHVIPLLHTGLSLCWICQQQESAQAHLAHTHGVEH
jgi:hypothetical protein